MTRIISIFAAPLAAKIQPFTSTEQPRYYLQGFMLEKHCKKGALIVATDGHRMGVLHDEAAYVAQDRDVIRLPKDFVKACKGKNGAGMSVYIDHTAQTAYLADTVERDALPANLADLPGCISIALKVIIDGTFPDWRRVCPAAPVDDCIKVTGFNAKYLADFGSISDNRNGGVLSVYSREPGTPAWVLVAGHPEFVGVLMPVRVATAPELPAWFTAQPKAAKQAA